MLRYKLLFLLCLIYTLQSNAQSEPMVIVDDSQFIDVHILDESIVYATRSALKEVSNQGDVKRIDGNGYVKGNFWNTEDGYIYLGWARDNGDYTLPGLLIAEQSADTFMRTNISLVDEFCEDAFSIQSAIYHSPEDIKILTSTIYNQTQWVYTLDSNGDFIDTLTLNTGEVVDMHQLQNNTYLLEGEDWISTMEDNTITFDKYLGDIIVDLNIYENQEIIEVLTSNMIVRMNYDLDVISQVDLVSSDKQYVAVYSHGDSTTVVSRLGSYSYITQDTVAVSQSIYRETVPVVYTNTEIKNGIHVIWGSNGCYPRGNVMKVGERTLLQPLDSVNLVADYFIVEKIGEQEEQIIQSNGDTTLVIRDINTYEISITNNGSETIDSFFINMGRQNIVFLSHTFIQELVPLTAGESRIYRDTVDNWWVDNMKLYVFSDFIESDCSDNSLNAEIITSNISIDGIYDHVLYPNPSSSVLFLDIDEVVQYQIFSCEGSNMQSGTTRKKEAIDIDILPAGSYFIRFVGVKLGTITKIFVKI